MTLNLGRSVTRVDAFDKVLGKTHFPGDLFMPDQATLKIRFADHPHAVIEQVDTSIAEALPGVIAVLTAKDVPVNEYGLIMPDQPVLCGPGSGNQFADRVRFLGDQIALVIAETEDIAATARDLISIRYRELPILSDAESAMQESSILIHPERKSNIFCQYKIRKGDVQKAFERSDVIIEQDYRTPVQEHVFLEPEAGIGYIDDQGKVTVRVAGQWAHEDQKQIAHALGLPRDQVRVQYAAIGGAFGGREDLSVQLVLALAAMHLHNRGIRRPVKIKWNREESIRGHHKRHAYRIKTKWGAKRDGKVIAVQAQVIADGGAYAYTSTKVLGNATLLVTGPYEIDHVSVDSFAVYTNNVPAGAFRGFGGPQAAFVAETQMNKLAEALKMDPVELRMRNILNDGSVLSVNTPVPIGVSLDQVVKTCALAGGWKMDKDVWIHTEHSKPHTNLGKTENDSQESLKHGIGFACAFKNIGFSFGYPEKCSARVELHGTKDIERVVVYHAGADCGQGAHTVFAQMAANAAGVQFDKVDLIVSDTAVTGDSGSTSASRMTFMGGNAIKGAVEKALSGWTNEERPAIGEYTYYPPRTTPLDPYTGESLPNFSYGYVAQVARVAVDLETGLIRVLELISTNDVGRIVNRMQVEGQIEGAVVQASGYTLIENFIQKDGRVKTPNLSTYLIPTVLDIPDKTQSIILEYPDPLGPWGIRGMGEMPYLPFAPAVIAAVHDATGVWFNEFPLLPEQVLRGLGKL